MGFLIAEVRGENRTPGHNKFYEMALIENVPTGKSVLIKHWGKIGTVGQYQLIYGTTYSCTSERMNISNTKRAKGYEGLHEEGKFSADRKEVLAWLNANHLKVVDMGVPAELAELLGKGNDLDYGTQDGELEEETPKPESKPEPIRSKDWSSW